MAEPKPYKSYAGARKPCYDCMKADATVNLGLRIKNERGREPLHVCKDCADHRLGRHLNKPEESAPVVPTRIDSFTSGHSNARMHQPELEAEDGTKWTSMNG